MCINVVVWKRADRSLLSAKIRIILTFNYVLFSFVGLSGDSGSGSECRAIRGLGMSRAEDLRAELLRAEHLKAEALWEENCDGSR